MRALLLALNVSEHHTRVLERDYRVVHASSLGQALELRPDLILARSLESCRGLLQFPVVLLTDSETDESFPTGVLDVLATSRPLQLRSRIDRLIAHLNQKRRLQADSESLIYSISHDLRAPLRAVCGFSELLMSEFGTTLDSEGLHFLERVCANAQRLSDMVEDLLALSRLFRDPLKPKKLDGSGMIHQILDRLKREEPQRSLLLEVEEDLWLVADRRMMFTVWDHLLGNAWKFARNCIQVGRIDGAFYVRDDGVGYDPERAGDLFRPFQQLHRGHLVGRGMGLATVARIVTGLGGQVWAESRPDEGATFFFRLPDETPN